jgi:hypothetical protein
MGRNSIPKLGEWRDGKLYRFRSVADRGDDSYPKPDDGRMIVYEVQRGKDGPVDVLGTAFADGFQSAMAAMWESGYERGLRAGKEQKLREVQSALGIER